MSEHARLSPSSAERWISCPGSLRLVESLPPATRHGDTVYAAEGTAAHELGEIKARHRFGQISADLYGKRRALWDTKHPDVDVEEMDRHTDAYVLLLEERMALYENSQIMLEQRLQTGIRESWGTSDAVIASPQHVEIVDLKYGQGVAVEARNNPQLRLYALGALDTYGDVLGETELVRATVFQPRLNHTLTEELTPEALRSWREWVRPIADLALGPDAPFGPSESACRWCPASGRCPAQLEDIFRTDFDVDPEYLGPAEMAEVLERVPRIRNWLNAFEEAALHTAYSEGATIPGWKVVLSGGRRVITDPELARTRLLARTELDIDDIAPRKLVGIGALEKLLGGNFREVLGSLVTRTDGKPALVPETDRRSAVDPNQQAQEEFRNR